ncbi:MAG: hypothetical protein JKY12_06770 [Sneathiella sp.]|nr:hypothetical protein [Sneathiella sp.]
MLKSLKLHDLEASRRLVNIAIRLHFSHADPVAIHALSTAAYKALRKLSAKAKCPDIVPEYLHYLKDEDRRLFWSSLSLHDPVPTTAFHNSYEQPFEIAEEITDLYLFISCAIYRLLNAQHTHEMKIFIIWYKAINRLRTASDPIYNANTKEGFDYLQSLPRDKQLKLGYDALKNLKPSSPDRGGQY